MVPAGNSSEKALIERAQRYEAEAVAELYKLHIGEIYRYCLFRVTDEATAEDLTEEVFLNMVEALPHYVDRGVPFVGWLYRIARARVVDDYRRRARRQTDELAETLADATPGPEDQAIRHAEIHGLKQAMARLSDDYHAVLQLRFMEGYGLEETARQMGKTIGATKVMQHRALRQLAQLLKK
jgi:RNA polymerase sigma-70 factor (ECF subfamily)